MLFKIFIEKHLLELKKKAKIALKVKKVWKKKVRSSVELKEYDNSYSSK